MVTVITSVATIILTTVATTVIRHYSWYSYSILMEPPSLKDPIILAPSWKASVSLRKLKRGCTFLGVRGLKLPRLKVKGFGV